LSRVCIDRPFTNRIACRYVSPTPEILHDALFGRLKWNPDIGWLEGRIEFDPGHVVRVTFVAEEPNEFPEIISRAHQQLPALKLKHSAIYARVREEFLALYNESWAGSVNGYGQPATMGKISVDKFDELVRLQRVSFQYGTGVDLWYFDGDELFGGHSILVQLDDNLEIVSTGLEG